MEKLVKAKVVANYTNECERTVYRKASAGVYPCYRSGNAVRFKLSEIDEAMKGDRNVKKDGTRCRSNPAN